MTRATFSTQVLRFTRGFVFYLSPISISRVPEKKVASTLIVFFLLRTVSYFSLQSYCTRNKPKQRKRRAVINEGVTS